MAFAAVTIVAVSFHTSRSELVQKDDYYLGPLWRTKSDSENILGSLALTGHVGETIAEHDRTSSAASKVFKFNSWRFNNGRKLKSAFSTEQPTCQPRFQGSSRHFQGQGTVPKLRHPGFGVDFFWNFCRLGDFRRSRSP